jgi:hypothetical protein
MSIMSNIAGAAGFSMGNITRNALKFVGLPEGVASAVGLVMDVKNGNIGSALFKTGPALLQALTGGQAGQANSVDRPSSILGTVAKVAGFGALAVGGAALVGGLGSGGAVASTALGGLSGMTKGILGLVAGLGMAAVGGKAGNMLFDLAGFGGPGGGIETKTLLGASRTQGGPSSALAALPKPAMFEDIIAAFMVDFVKDKQNEIEKKLDGLRQNAQNAGKTAGDKGGGFISGIVNTVTGGVSGKAENGASSSSGESRNIEFEMLKNEMQKLSQMQQAMSGVLNALDATAMNAIRNLKG